jgi:hypothetical protein
MRPPVPQHRELRLDIREVGGEEQEPQEKDVVERRVRRRDLAPRERPGGASHPREAERDGHADRARDGPRTDRLVVLHQERADARRQQEDGDVEERPDLEADGDELAPGHAVEVGGLLDREDVLGAQPGDGGDDVRVHGVEIPRARPCRSRRWCHNRASCSKCRGW